MLLLSEIIYFGNKFISMITFILFSYPTPKKTLSKVPMSSLEKFTIN